MAKRREDRSFPQSPTRTPSLSGVRPIQILPTGFLPDIGDWLLFLWEAAGHPNPGIPGIVRKLGRCLYFGQRTAPDWLGGYSGPPDSCRQQEGYRRWIHRLPRSLPRLDVAGSAHFRWLRPSNARD